MKRTPLHARSLPSYTRGEEIMNAVTHMAGGLAVIAYTAGAVLFGLGSRLRWMHSVLHLFVILGSLLQLVTVAQFVL